MQDAIQDRTGDQVLPLRFWDSNDVFLKLALDFTFRFDDVLDPEKLRSSLERLLQIGDWHQMGARYKKNSKGKVELRIPQQYDEDRPGFVWSHDNRQQSITENELARRIPRLVKASRPTLHDDSCIFEDLVTRPGHPTKLIDWTEKDHPALSVHVVSFTDATLITLSWPHVFFDALGRQSLLQAWTAVLDGREEDVPVFVPYKDDPIVAIAEGAKPSDYVLFTSALTGIWFVLFIINFIFEILIHPKEASLAELVAKGAREQDVFLSHGDVLLAFWCKTTLAAQHLRPSRPVHIINAMNLRGVSAELPSPDKSAYIGNAVIGALTLTTVAEIEALSMSELASRVREDLKTQKEPRQVKSLVAWTLDRYKSGARLAMVGSWNQIMFSWSNWNRARFYEVDFSSAVVRSGLNGEDRMSKLGRPSFIMNRGHGDGISIRNGGPLIGEDANGDWWVSWPMRAEAWSEVEKALKTC
ncbi:hypothetical protein EKO04_003352 [Ascochyta lentis]|uniref:Uncharacterized protein n=1 Tax=Ascochyta lentis TaxID=205686 RepID=A0A8H7JA14_9PLEO|nr:hypothetical protein EKO04_003352 [Ascochyta lentis]